MKIITLKESLPLLSQGKIGIIPTDTIYGLVGLAQSKAVVERIYKIKGRDPKKPLIILIDSDKKMADFKVKIDSDKKALLDKWWPGKISVILPCSSNDLDYLHRGSYSLAFRVPDLPDLRNLIKKTGALVAPSANPEGEKPAQNIEEAQKYFGDLVDFYVGGEYFSITPSTLVEIKGKQPKTLRKGAVEI